MCEKESDILDDFIRIANEAADAAGAVVKKFFENPRMIQIFDKYDEDGCIVEQNTNVDLDAEDAMISVILQNFPDHLVFGEERGWLPKKRDADYVWVVDPIDGTTSFKNGVPLFGTLIPLLYKSKPKRGRSVGKKNYNGWSACTDPFLSATFTSNTGLLLFRYASSPLHFSDEELMDFHHVTEKVQEPIYGVECFTYRLSFWPYDFLAFIPIIEGAGGIITDWAGQKLKWEASPTFIGPSYYRIIAAGDNRVYQDALQYLTSA